jgi:hypothetical protein
MSPKALEDTTNEGGQQDIFVRNPTTNVIPCFFPFKKDLHCYSHLQRPGDAYRIVIKRQEISMFRRGAERKTAAAGNG